MLPVQGNVYMLVADGVNLTASVGAEGVLLVNTGAAAMTDKVLAALDAAGQRHGDAADAQHAAPAPTVPAPGAGPARTSTRVISSPAPPQAAALHHQHQRRAEHVGGNEKIAGGRLLPARRRLRRRRRPASGSSASIIAHENVLNRMSAPAGKQPPAMPEAAWPTDTYFDEFHKLPEYFNGEAVIVYHAPAANTDGDSLVFFRHSEVISAGNLFSTVSYPVIDVAEGRQHPGRASTG